VVSKPISLSLVQIYSPRRWYRRNTPKIQRLLVGIYLFYENGSTESFSKEELKKGALCCTYLSSQEISKVYRRFTIEINKKGRAISDPALIISGLTP
jgi:hypothetical protein